MIKNIDIKGYAYYGFGQIMNLLTPIIVAPKLISICGMENWGKIAVATSILMILNIFIDYGNLINGIKEISTNRESPAKIRKYLNSTYQLKIITLIVVFLLFFSTLFFLDYEVLLYSFGFLFLISQAVNPIWYFQAFEDFKKINHIIFFSRITYICLIFLFIRHQSDYVYAFLFLGISNLIVYSYFLRKIFIKHNISLFRKSIKLSFVTFRRELPIVVSNLSIALYINLPILIINNILGNYESGVYKIADMIITMFRSYLSVFFSVSFPKFCNIFSRQKEEGLNYLKRVNLFNIIALFVFLFITFIIGICFPFEKYFDSEMVKYIKFCLKFIYVPLIIALNIPFYQILLYKSKQKMLSYISVISTLLMFTSCYFLTVAFHLNGSIISLYLVEIFMTLSFIIYFLSLNNSKDRLSYEK